MYTSTMTELQEVGRSPAPLDVASGSWTDAGARANRRSLLQIDAANVPVNQNGCFEVDRVLKSGCVQKRTGKTKQWKTIYLVLRPSTLSMYKTDKEDKLRHQIYLSDLTAVAFLKDRKHKRDNVFGLFSPSKNFHFQAPTPRDAVEWVELIRNAARIEEEEEEMFLASPTGTQHPPGGFFPVDDHQLLSGDDRMMSSSPEAPYRRPPPPGPVTGRARRRSSYFESSGLSGNELASHSDFSDNDAQRLQGASIESLAVQSPALPALPPGSLSPGSLPLPPPPLDLRRAAPPGGLHARSASQLSIPGIEQDPDRVVWQGRLWLLRSKGGVRQWKDLWGVLRPRNLILYKDQSEYTAQRIIRLSAIVSVVEIDPLSRSKPNCLQVITEEKSYRFCAHDEESLVQCLGAFKSLLAKRRELEARAAAAVGGGVGIEASSS